MPIITNFILKDTLIVNNYTVKLYHIENEDIIMESITGALVDLDPTALPNKIIERVEPISGVSKIEIYDSDNELLINSEKIITL